MKDTFCSYHPVTNFVFYLGALALGMFLLHPAFLVCSVFCAGAYYTTIRGRAALPFLAGMLGLFFVLAVTNPLFNRYGSTVLFTYFGGLPYTLEALCYGMALGAMAISVMLWFASWHIVMTSEKLLYLFGGLSPSIALILTMVLRLLPAYRKKLTQLDTARRGIGMSADAGTIREKLNHGFVLVSALTSWALEGGIVMADSMRSRGFGCGRRTAFSLNRFERRDKFLLLFMAVLLVCILFCTARGGAAAAYTPKIQLSGPDNGYTAAGTFLYFMFLIIPAAVNVREDMIWHILKSGI